MGKKTEIWLCILVVVGLIGISALNRLYRVSSREGIPMLSMEALVAGWPYWLGGAIGLVLVGAYHYNTRK